MAVAQLPRDGARRSPDGAKLNPGRSGELEYPMAKAVDWHERAKSVLKSELKRRNVGYKELTENLGKIGVEENAGTIANKLARGGFSGSRLYS